MKKILKGFGYFFIFVFVVAIAGAISRMGGDKPNIEGSENDNIVEKVEVDDFTIEGELDTSESNEYALYISGIIKNNTSKDKSYVQVIFSLYDADGNLIGSAIDNVNNLKAGGTWKFKAMGMEADAASYELDKITGI